MITEEDLQKMSGVEILPKDSSEKFGFQISTTDASKMGLNAKKIVIEVRCPVVGNRLHLSKADIFRPGGGAIPSAWTAENLERMLSNMIELESRRREREQVIEVEEQQKAAEEIISQKISDAAQLFIRDRDPLSSIRDFIDICMKAYIMAATTKNE
jgi:hypothetical protein